MNSKLLLAGIVIVVLVAIGSLQLANITGFIASDEGTPSVKLKIDDGTGVKTYTVPIGSGESALDVLTRTATVDYKTYGNLGAFIREIDGKMQDENHSWFYYVNDEVPLLACSHYYPNNDDVITFRYVNLMTEEAADYFK